MSLNIFFYIKHVLPMLFVYRFLWPLRLVSLLVCCLYKEIYLQILKCVSFWLQGCCGEWEGWARKPLNHISLMVVVTRTDCPNSVRNRCVIELFVALFVLSLCPFDISVGVGAFVIWLSQISSFLSACLYMNMSKTFTIRLAIDIKEQREKERDLS